jgi:hypothetical protein
MSVLSLRNLREDVAAAATKASQSAAPATERKPSDFWLNIGVTIPGPDGEPLFVSLPIGLALDDMKPQAIRGSNQDWINLAQTKNTLLETLQQHAASMEPGERQTLDVLSVEIYRRKDTQTPATAGEENPLVANLMASLQGRPRAA